MKRSILALGGICLATWAISRSLRSKYSFTGKVVIVTGGSRGLGLAIARHLAREGARLALFARGQEELERACAELRAMGGEALPVPCDLLERDQLLGAVATVVDHFGRIDVLINNAGIIEIGPLENMRRPDFEKSMQLHFWAPFNLIQQAIPHFRRVGGGRIVNIASIGGKVAVPHMAPYSASKFALVGLSDAFRTELARDDIRVTTVTPGLMRTGSQLHAQFKGNHGAEFTWFTLSASLPFSAVDGDRAAELIVEACRRGQSSLVIGWSTRAGMIGNAVFPSLTGEVMKLINRFLPSPVGVEGDETKSGREARAEQSVPHWIARLGDSAMARHNEG
ncbi:MAG: SDR family NAD(P)-dependent oxidoreductase [Chthoniobacterales bacterium]